MTHAIMLAVGLTVFCAFAQGGESASSQGGQRILIAYFSKTGNTRTIAEEIQRRAGGDLFHVTTRNPYPEDYRQTTDAARAELNNNVRPELAQNLTAEEMGKYDVIFLGYPNWWGTIPMALFTFLEAHDLAGKTILPFCTHEGSGLGRGPSDIERLSPGATLQQGLAVRGGSVASAQADVDGWLRRLGYAR